MEKANQKAMMMKIVNWMRKNKDHPGITELNQGWDSNNRMVWNGGKQVTNVVDMFEYNNIGGWGWNWWEHTCTGAGVDGPALKTDKLISTGQWAHLGFACSQRHCFSAQLALHWAFLVALAICPSLLSPVPSLASLPPFWYSPTFFSHLLFFHLPPVSHFFNLLFFLLAHPLCFIYYCQDHKNFLTVVPWPRVNSN